MWFLAGAFLLVQAGDLFTFLIAMRVVDASREIGPIGSVWVTFGDLGAAAYKLLPAVLIVWVCVTNEHLRAAKVVLLVGTVLGALGVVLNSYAAING